MKEFIFHDNYDEEGDVEENIVERVKSVLVANIWIVCDLKTLKCDEQNEIIFFKSNGTTVAFSMDAVQGFSTATLSWKDLETG